MDTNEVGAFINRCTQGAYLRNLIYIIELRLADLGEAKAVCPECSGTKKVVKDIGEKMTEVPCPRCQPKVEIADSVADSLVKENARLFEEIKTRDGMIQGLREQVEQMLAQVRATATPQVASDAPGGVVGEKPPMFPRNIAIGEKVYEVSEIVIAGDVIGYWFGEYEILGSNPPAKCNCPAFTFNQTCKHVDALKEMLGEPRGQPVATA